MKFKCLILTFLSITLYCSQEPPSIKAIVFDIGGVLENQARWPLYLEMLQPLCSYCLAMGELPPSPIDFLFSSLERYSGKQSSPAPLKACALNKELPQCMCTWLMGKITEHDIITTTVEQADKDPEMNAAQKALLKKLLEIVFDEKSTQYSFVPNEAEQLVIDCDNAGYKLFILSNFSREGFTRLEQKEEFDIIFALIPQTHRIISGFVGAIKPYLDMFELLIKKTGYKASELIFIDDQKENIEAAQAYGINTIHLSRGNYGEVREALKTFGVKI